MICNIKDIPVYYEEYGSGRPVLCIHGYVVDHRMMTGCMEPVFEKRPGYRRIYMDLPGMGKTPSSSDINSADKMLEIIMEFSEKVIPEDTFLLAVQSYAGYLARGMVYYMKEKIDGILFIAPVFESVRAKRVLEPNTVVFKENGVEEKVDPKHLKGFLGLSVLATYDVWLRHKKEVVDGEALADRAFLRYYEKNCYTLSIDEQIKTYIYDKPVCILAGRQDHIVGYKDMIRDYEYFPRAVLSVFDVAGHSLQIERKELFDANVNDWLERIDLEDKINGNTTAKKHY